MLLSLSRLHSVAVHAQVVKPSDDSLASPGEINSGLLAPVGQGTR